MKPEDIWFHDCRLVRVVEIPASDLLAFEVTYPIDWYAGEWGPKTILFTEVLNYEVREGPYQGAPSMLTYSTEPDGERTRLTIETTAGRRTLSFLEVSLLDGHRVPPDAASD